MRHEAEVIRPALGAGGGAVVQQRAALARSRRELRPVIGNQARPESELDLALDCRCRRGHGRSRSAEPGSRIALEHLELEPLLDLRMRLGEGTGGLLAVPLVQAAARTLAEMATLEELGFG